MRPVDSVASSLRALADSIDNEPQEPVGVDILRCAACLLEIAGYELARTHNSGVAASVILQSSEAEKTVERLNSFENEATGRFNDLAADGQDPDLGSDGDVQRFAHGGKTRKP